MAFADIYASSVLNERINREIIKFKENVPDFEVKAAGTYTDADGGGHNLLYIMTTSGETRSTASLALSTLKKERKVHVELKAKQMSDTQIDFFLDDMKLVEIHTLYDGNVKFKDEHGTNRQASYYYAMYANTVFLLVPRSDALYMLRLKRDRDGGPRKRIQNLRIDTCKLACILYRNDYKRPGLPAPATGLTERRRKRPANRNNQDIPSAKRPGIEGSEPYHPQNDVRVRAMIELEIGKVRGPSLDDGKIKITQMPVEGGRAHVYVNKHQIFAATYGNKHLSIICKPSDHIKMVKGAPKLDYKCAYPAKGKATFIIQAV